MTPSTGAGPDPPIWRVTVPTLLRLRLCHCVISDSVPFRSSEIRTSSHTLVNLDASRSCIPPLPQINERTSGSQTPYQFFVEMRGSIHPPSAITPYEHLRIWSVYIPRAFHTGSPVQYIEQVSPRDRHRHVGESRLTNQHNEDAAKQEILTIAVLAGWIVGGSIETLSFRLTDLLGKHHVLVAKCWSVTSYPVGFRV